MKPLFVNLLLSFGASLLTCVLGELAFRVIAPAPPILRIQPNKSQSAIRLSENPLLGYEYKTSYRAASEPNNHDNYSYTNAHGLRDIERSEHKAAGVQRILLLGDSVVAGQGISNIDDTISRQLEFSLNRNRSAQIEVLNFGTVGYNTVAEAELLRVKGIKFNPDLVLHLFVYNDYENFGDLIRYFNFPRPPLTESLFLFSHLFRALALRYDLWHFRSELEPNYLTDWQLHAVGENNVATGLGRLVDLQKEFGFKLVTLLWPSFGDRATYADYPRADGTSSELNVEKLAAGLGLRVFRLDERFNQLLLELRGSGSVSPDATARNTFATDGMHPSEAGAKYAAEILRSILVAEKLIN